MLWNLINWLVLSVIIFLHVGFLRYAQKFPLIAKGPFKTYVAPEGWIGIVSCYVQL